MTRQQLEYFLSAAEFCNMSRAAAYHYISVPTFARSINDLEDEFNTRLFERNNRGLIITRSGILFHRFAWNTLSRMYDFQNNVSSMNLLKQEAVNPFFIGYYPFGGTYVELAKLMDRFFQVWLKKQCSLRCVESGKMINYVRTERLQVGTISEITFDGRENTIFESRTLLRSDFQLLVGQAHPFAGLAEIDAQDLLTEYGLYEDYLPFRAFENREYENRQVESIHSLAWASVRCLPVWQHSFDNEDADHDELSESMFVLPSMLQRPEFSVLHTVKIKNVPTHSVKIFWLRDNDSEDIQNFKSALDFAGIV